MGTRILLLLIRTVLALFITSIVWGAYALGVHARAQDALLRAHRLVGEELAIQCSYAAQRGDLAALEATVQTVTHGRSDIWQATLVREDGSYWARYGGEQNLAGAPPSIQFPIALQDRKWGTLDIQFAKPAGAGVPRHIWGIPAILLTALGLLLIVVKFAPISIPSPPARIQSTIDALSEGIVILDRERRIALANESFARIIGLPRENLEGSRLEDLSRFQQSGASWAELESAQAGIRVDLSAPGDDKVIQLRTAPLFDDQGRQRGTLATFEDVTAMERRTAQCRELLDRYERAREELHRKSLEFKLRSTIDPLTGSALRLVLLEDLEQMWLEVHRCNSNLACILVDVDDLHLINEKYGLTAGDHVLQDMASLLKTAVRPIDRIYRYSGDEFCILLPFARADHARSVAERLCEQINATPCENVLVSASFAVVDDVGVSQPRALLDRAERALARAKSIRGCVMAESGTSATDDEAGRVQLAECHAHLESCRATLAEAKEDTAVLATRLQARRLGLVAENLAIALEGQEIAQVRMRARELAELAHAGDLQSLGQIAAALEEKAASDCTWLELVQLTVPVLDTCRAAYETALSGLSEVPTALEHEASRSVLLADKRERMSKLLLSTTIIRELVEKNEQELQRKNHQLRQEVHERQRAEEEVQKLNTELEKRVQERTAQLDAAIHELSTLAAHLSEAEDHERRRVALDIHDTIGQTLPVVKMKLQAFRIAQQPSDSLAEVLRLLDQAMEQTRTLTFELYPAALDDLGLVPALRWYVQKLERLQSLRADIVESGLPGQLTPAVAHHLFRATRELLHNVAKHAQAGEAIVQVNWSPQRVRIVVSDGGCGFQVATTPKGVGLLSIRERVASMNGQFYVESEPGQGTRVILEVPTQTMAPNLSSKSER